MRNKNRTSEGLYRKCDLIKLLGITNHMLSKMINDAIIEDSDYLVEDDFNSIQVKGFLLKLKLRKMPQHEFCEYMGQMRLF